MLSNRLNISKVLGNKFASRIIERKSEKWFSADAEKATEEFECEIEF